VPEDYYGSIILEARERKIKTYADTKGPVLKCAIEALPYLLGVNIGEFADVLGLKADELLEHPALVAEHAKELADRGVDTVVISMGKAGIVMCTAEGSSWAHPPLVEKISDVGAGDSIKVAFAYAELQGWQHIEALRLAAAASAATVTMIDSSSATLEHAQLLLDDVKIEPLEPADAQAGGAQTLNTLLRNASQQGYCIPAFVASFGFDEVKLDLFIEAVIEAAMREDSPVIALCYPDGLRDSGLGPAQFKEKVMAAKERLAAQIPVFVGLDHGSPKKEGRLNVTEFIDQAREAGFDIVTADARADELEGVTLDDAIVEIRQIVQKAHAKNVLVEGVFGEVGPPSDPDQAVAFAEKTGIDALAVSVGTIHGGRADESTALDLSVGNRIAELTSVPIVAHGGTSLRNSHLAELPLCNIAKLNVGTILLNAAKAAYKTHPDDYDIIKGTVRNVAQGKIRRLAPQQGWASVSAASAGTASAQAGEGDLQSSMPQPIAAQGVASVAYVPDVSGDAPGKIALIVSVNNNADFIDAARRAFEDLKVGTIWQATSVEQAQPLLEAVDYVLIDTDSASIIDGFSQLIDPSRIIPLTADFDSQALKVKIEALAVGNQA
jgi:fructose/tagatose bisphosphate aldolase